MRALKPTIRLFLIGLSGGILGSALVLAGRALAVEGTLTISGSSQTLTGDITAARIVDSANSAYFIDPAAAGTSMSLAGAASISGNLTLPQGSAMRPAFGPTTLSYKSGMDAWTTGLIIQDGTGNVGIGTTAPAQKLDVVGTVKATAFSGDGSSLTGIAGTPAGAVVFFNLASCPTGWTELTAARGMTMVGLPAAGTLAGTVGTAFTNLENRTHTHTVDIWPSDKTGTILSDGLVDRNRFWTSGGPNPAWSALNWSGIYAPVTYGKRETSTTATNTSPYIQLLACQKS